MRDSPLKQALLRAYFSAGEVRSALLGMVRTPQPLRYESNYDEYWQLREPGALQPRFHLMADQLEPGASLLDVGCGDGALLELLVQRGVRAVGIDVSEVAVLAARRRGVSAEVRTLDDLAQSGASYDYVVLSEVLEHVADPERMVCVAWGLCRKALFLTFPNIAYLPHRLRLAAGRFPVQWAVFPGEHLRFWAVPDFRDWLRGLGLPEGRIEPSNGIVVFGLHRRWPNLFANQVVVRVDRAAQ